ncbi:hypothetical protein CBS101457_002560 [Exobasidium rhododendri]|nr:hypothetical protein CBS101457_002560 [Exobasidium rhododendri]
MTSLSLQKRQDEAQDLTNRGVSSEFERDYSTAFQCYVRAGELYLGLMRDNAVGVQVSSRWKAAAEKVLSRAEKIKQIKTDVKIVERRLLSEEEQARAIEGGSFVDSTNLPEWNEKFIQPGPLSAARPQPLLSTKQEERNGRYQRRSDNTEWARHALYDTERPLRGSQIVQRIVTDCSFVAALEVAAEHDSKWKTNLAHAPLYPKSESGYPVWSDSSIHNVKIRFNGKDRCVSVDESIPCYPDGTPICATGIVGDRLHIWPSLLEKAYISLRGGYHFAGSNSSIDLHALTGWVPEQIGFQHAGFQREKAWERVKDNYEKGILLITAGTTKDMEGKTLLGQADLIDSHNYAVVDLQEDDGNRWLILMNPWETGPNREIIKMSWSEACARLDSLYLNWSPDIFQCSRTWHGTWRDDSMQNASIHVMAKEASEIWLLLTRHITQSRQTATEWIALHVFGSHDDPTPQKETGVYVDSSHTLVRVQVKPGARRITASRQGGTGQATFTLFAYSIYDFCLQDIPITPYPHSYPIRGQWSRKTAGGNATHSTFLHNPQYVLRMSARTNLQIILDTSKEIAVQVALIWSQGKRVSQITQGDIVASSGTYNYGLAIAEAKDIKPGLYTLIVSTFETGKVGEFGAQLKTDQPCQVDPLPPEGAGMFRHRLYDRWQIESARGSPKHSTYFLNPTFEITVDRSSLFIFRLSVTRATAAQVRPQINVAIFTKSERREVVSSGPYSDPPCGVSIDETRLEAGDYLVVVSTYDAGVAADFTLDVYSDRRIVYHKL